MTTKKKISNPPSATKWGERVKRIYVNIINNMCQHPLESKHNPLPIGKRSNTPKSASGKDMSVSITATRDLEYLSDSKVLFQFKFSTMFLLMMKFFTLTMLSQIKGIFFNPQALG